MPKPAYPTFYRVREHRMISGVCTGLAAHLGVELRWVRLFFAAAMLLPGLGISLYVALVACSKTTTDISKALNESSRRRIIHDEPGVRGIDSVFRPINNTDWLFLALGAVFLVFGALLSAGQSLLSLLLGAAAVGVYLVWETFGLPNTTLTRRHKSAHLMSLIVGVVLLIGSVSGALFFLGLANGTLNPSATVGWAFLASLLLILGLIVVLVPLWLRLWSFANRTAQEKAAENERAKIASRIHDSVLQTLTLIQKSSSEPATVSLARSQERQLRQWLFEEEQSVVPDTLFGAARVACGEVEDTFGITIRPVLVGEDIASTEAIVDMVLAAREAMVNSAKHSGCDEVNVYVEAAPQSEKINLFVRDRGRGFDLGAIPADRQGVRQSIIARMKRVGGTVQFDTSSRGTEVIFSIPKPE
ncbi:PspC domain-containing protein [Corynebacterium sp. 4HC-13]|uniref:ATP-binding protein n=1 Tax=Corynebacterium anserum TaxID=2684406 RepID=UPI00163981D5|nr:ATP-binding protein [Corynebacterium anserum]MBC2682586.1 PspC domain-containing protein [Corynebacterium anserum]